MIINTFLIYITGRMEFFLQKLLVHAEVWGVLILVSIFGLNDQLVVIHGIFVDSY